jgi:GNAT superfamily N-acetyltransferase
MSNESGSGEPVRGQDSVLEYEKNFLKEKQEGPKRPPRALCGLALSGGGMRSATFNLGLLQGLHQLKLLGLFDYLATVSGGGYTGGFWTAWRHHAAKKQSPLLFPTVDDRSRGAHLREVRHLREFSNFLRPRMGLLSPDTGRMMTAMLSAILPSLLATLSLLVLTLLAWHGLAWLLLAGWPEGQPAPFTRRLLSGAVMFLVTCAWLCFCERRLLAQEQRVKEVRRDDTRPAAPDTPASGQKGFHYDVMASVLTSLLVLGLWLLQLNERLHVFSPALAWVAAAGVLVLRRWSLSRWMTQPSQCQKTSASDRILSRLLILAALWSVFSAFWLAGQLIRENPHVQSYQAWAKTGLVGFIVALTTAFAKLQQLFGRQTNKPVSPTRKSTAKALLPQFLAYAILALLVLAMVLLLQAVEENGWRWLGVPLLVAGALTVFTLRFFDPNNVGLHGFYRSRLARTFIGAAHGNAPGQTELHEDDDLALDELKQRSGPFHLICCAANDLSPEDPMLNLYRGATSAVLSSEGFSVGGEGRRWAELRGAGAQVPTLAAAMTASGAALNSHMGSMSMRMGRAVTFLMTAFNLRLGLWWPHPTRARDPRKQHAWVGWPFYQELLGRSRARSEQVLLSDGGHFENLALYELVRRRCQFILVSDCGMDTETEFNDFANAVRRVREDFQVEIRIDLSPLRPEANGQSRQTIVAGDIEYPDGNTGVLLLVKPTMLGNEPADITHYKARNAAFPHESTGDQFYDEAQWEAYRRLGEHAALTAFRPVRKVMDQLEEQPVASRVFARARFHWLPVPAGYEERYSRFAAQASSLDALLQQGRGRKLFRQVFNEITELDAQAKQQLEAHPGGLSRLLRRKQRAEEDRATEQGVPSAEELADALHLLRRALLFMEEVFLTEKLAIHYNHPVYTGVMNYFARWAYAPIFRTWWPLLKTQYSPGFTLFLEDHFSLPGMERQDIGKLSDVRGFAMRCWLEQKGRLPHEGQESLVSYQLNMPYGGQPQYYIQAAQLIVRTRDAEGRPLRYRDGGTDTQLLVWQGDDFYVPPGLWGAGIGEDFLGLLHSDRRLLDHVGDAGERSLLAVRLLVDQDASAARRKRWADAVQLYRSQGFSEPGQPLQPLLESIDVELDEDPALKWPGMKCSQWRRYWLVRRFSPKVLTAEYPDSATTSRDAEASGQPVHH